MKFWGIAGRLLVTLGVIGLAYPSIDLASREAELLLSSYGDSAAMFQPVIPTQPGLYWTFIGFGVGLIMVGMFKRLKRSE